MARLRRASLVEQGLLAPAEAERFERAAAGEFRELLARGTFAGWLLVAEGSVAGCASMVFWERLPYAGGSLHAELAGLFVEPAFRRRGFARALCRQAIAFARSRSVRTIVVHASPQGRELYRELGFGGSNQMRLCVQDFDARAAAGARM